MPEHDPLSGVILDESISISLRELCRSCDTNAEWVLALVNEGILTPIENDPTRLRFAGSSVKIAYTAKRLQSDLGLNFAGIALALDLLSELEQLRARVARLSDLDQPHE